MIIDIDQEEREVMVRLVDEAIRDIGPEIHHTMTSSYKDDLKDYRRVLKELRARLMTECPSEPAAEPSTLRTSEPGGTP